MTGLSERGMAGGEPKCGCFIYCGDLEEHEDDPRAVCRGLRMPPHEPLVEIVLEHKGERDAHRAARSLSPDEGQAA